MGLYKRVAEEIGDAVVEYLEGEGAGMTARYLAGAFGYREAAAKAILAELVKAGRVARVHTVYFAVAA